MARCSTNQEEKKELTQTRSRLLSQTAIALSLSSQTAILIPPFFEGGLGGIITPIALSSSSQNSDRAFPLTPNSDRASLSYQTRSRLPSSHTRSRFPSHPKPDVAKPLLYEHRAKIAIKS